MPVEVPVGLPDVQPDVPPAAQQGGVAPPEPTVPALAALWGQAVRAGSEALTEGQIEEQIEEPTVEPLVEPTDRLAGNSCGPENGPADPDQPVLLRVRVRVQAPV